MTEEEYKALNFFINDLLYEKMTIDDYYYIMEKLGARRRLNRFSAICHEVDSTKYNLSFDEESRCFYCFSECNCSYSLLSLIKKRRELLNENSKTIPSLKWLCQELNIEFNFKEEAQKSNTDRYNWKVNLNKYLKGNRQEKILPKYDKKVLEYFPKIYHEDWLDYGISEETMDKYNIRYYPYKNQIVIPCYDHNGNMCGIRIRNMNKELLETTDIPKYMPLKMLDGMEYKFPTNLCFYGENFNSQIIKKKKQVFIVEAEKSVMKADTWFPNDNTFLALYGSAIGQEQIKYLLELGVETIIIGLDSDFKEIKYSDNGNEKTEYEKFEEKVLKMYKQLKPYFSNIYVFYNNLGFEDCYKFSPTDYTREQFDMLLESKERIDLEYENA